MTPTYDVFCYGEVGTDNIIQVEFLPTPERAAFPIGDSYHVGGAAANTAVWLAAFGFSTGLSGNHIGDDAYGQNILRSLDAHNHLDRRYLRVDQQTSTPFCRVMVTPDGERSFLIFGYLEAEKVPLTPGMLHGTRYLALDLYGGEERLDAAQVGRAAGVLNTAGDVIDPAHPILPLIDIVTNSASYIREAMPGADIRGHSLALQAVSRGVVITTDGPRPIWVVDRDRRTFSVQPPKVTAVDATGAGDAFRAGLLAGLLRGKSLADSVRWGAAAGARSVEHLGAATVIPGLEEVIALGESLRIESGPKA